MHRVTLPSELVQSLAANSRRERFFASFDAARTALLNVDMQSHWVDVRGACYLPAARSVVPNINRLCAAVRAAGGTVVWIQSTMTAHGPGAWSHFFDHLTTNGEAERAELTAGHPMHALWRELEVSSEDLLAAKNRFSAFIQGASDLERILRARGIDTVVITGVATNICCESTARDAMMLDFRTVVIQDATAARTDEDHLAGLRTVAQVFGAVMSADELIVRLRARRA